LAGWAINEGERCLTISTDGGFWLGDPHLDQSETAKELAKFYSGIRHEDEKNPIDELWIGRNRCYVAWHQGVVVHAAQGGIAVLGSSDEKKKNFEKMVRDSIAAGKEMMFESETTRLTGLMDFIHDDIPLNSAQHKKKKLSWNFDGKRKLDREINVFAENTFTTPYETVEEAFRAQYSRDTKAGRYGEPAKMGRPQGRTQNSEVIEEIRVAPRTVTHKELAKKYGVSESTIKRIRGSR
jgi:hypothetical protein